jgi:hypothetical protein
VYLSLLFCSYFVVLRYFDVLSCFVGLCISIFVCTSAGLLSPGESPIAVSSSSSKVKVKLSHYWPGGPLGLSGV